MRRIALVFVAVLCALALLAPHASARALWKRRIDRIAGRHVGVAVRFGGAALYGHNPRRRRIPASNQKLLVSMALLDRLGPGHRIETLLATGGSTGPVLNHNLWVLGRGDPTITPPGYAPSLPPNATRIGDLARAIKDAGITRIEGRVIASTGHFRHDWFAPGWRYYFPAEEVPLPSALTYRGNVFGGRHVSNPEIRLARALTHRLRDVGVRVLRRPRARRAPDGLRTLATVASPQLEGLLRFMNHRSSNFFAEVLGKVLAVARRGPPGTIAKGAAAATAWARARGVDIRARDSSGLSYRNRVSPRGLVRLLAKASRTPWGPALRRSLPAPGEGTLEDRLAGTPVRAKTGTLEDVSALSGYVWLRRRSGWAEFSIMSSGLSKDVAVGKENRIVRILRRRAR